MEMDEFQSAPPRDSGKAAYRRTVALPDLPDGFTFSTSVERGKIWLRLRRPSGMLAGEESATSAWGLRRAARRLAKIAWLSTSAEEDER